MSLKSFLYKFFIKSLSILPFKKGIYKLIRKNEKLTTKTYKDLKFNGIFNVDIEEREFLMYHHGGRIENETFWFGLFNSFEVDTGWLWLLLAKESEVIFDIGANTGIYSLVSKTLNKNAKVYAFEPSRNTFHKLQKNNQINNYDIECCQIAFSNSDGEAVFYDSFNHNQTSASLSSEMMKNWEDYKANEYKVKTMKVDTFIAENKIEKLDLVKIDVEMHEPEVLEGFQAIYELKPIIFIEVLTDDVANKVNEFFKEGFVFYHLNDEKHIIKMSQIKTIPLKWNYILCPVEKEQMLINISI